MQTVYHTELIPADGSPAARFGASIFDGQCRASRMASRLGCDVAHRVYNDALYRWEYLGTYHGDGTATSFTGERRLFTGDRQRPWASLVAETQKGGAR